MIHAVKTIAARTFAPSAEKKTAGNLEISKESAIFDTFNNITRWPEAAEMRFFSSLYDRFCGSVPPCGTCNASATPCEVLNSGKGGAAFYFLPTVQIFTLC